MAHILDDQATAQIVAEYQAGASLAQLAERWCVSAGTIYLCLTGAGVAMRPRGGNNNPNGRRGRPADDQRTMEII